MKKRGWLFLSTFLVSCGKGDFVTQDYVDLDRFVTTWYVIAGRFTSFEQGAHNPTEKYSWAENHNYIHVDFSFNKDSFTGMVKHIPQKAWVYNTQTNAHWKIRPFWPLKLNYLILAVAKDYSWSAVGVPNQKYLWIMAKEKKLSQEAFREVIDRLNAIGYSTKQLQYAKHKT